MQRINIKTPYIKLVQLVKLANLSASGGEAKKEIQSGKYTVNEKKEIRPGRKIKNGDMVSDGKDVIHVHQDGGNDEDKKTSS